MKSYILLPVMGAFIAAGFPAGVEIPTAIMRPVGPVPKKASSASRRSMDRHLDSPSGHFRVHYDISGKDAPDMSDNDGNGVPDYVDSTMTYLEYARDLFVDELGYAEPVPDGGRGGSDATDCYIRDLGGEGMYGCTTPDEVHDAPSPAYLTIDNDFAENVYAVHRYDALRVTTAHELFHAIHLAYLGNYDAVWFMEQCSLWAENRAWDDVDGYLGQIRYFLEDREKPLDTKNGAYEYGATLFAFMIDELYGEDCLRMLWERIRDRRSADIAVFDAVLPEGLTDAVAELGVWSWFTGERASDIAYYREAFLMRAMTSPSAVHEGTTIIDSLSLNRYTFKYVDIEPGRTLTPDDSLHVRLAYSAGSGWESRLMFYNGPNDFSVTTLEETSAVVAPDRSCSSVILVVANASRDASSGTCTYRVNPWPPAAVEVEAPGGFVLKGNRPNPFNPVTTIDYELDRTGHAELSVYSVNGQRVATLVDGVLTAGSHAAVFDGSGVASGPLFAVLRQGGRRKVMKMMLVK